MANSTDLKKLETAKRGALTTYEQMTELMTATQNPALMIAAGEIQDDAKRLYERLYSYEDALKRLS